MLKLSPGQRGRGFLFLDLGHGYLTAQRWPHIETLDCFCKGVALVVGVDSSEVLQFLANDVDAPPRHPLSLLAETQPRPPSGTPHLASP